MPDPNDRDPIDNKILVDAVAEIKEMAKEGAAHPSTKPVVIGGAIGWGAGVILFNGLWPLTLLAGAGFMLYKRIRP